jgi:hypothetical protein
MKLLKSITVLATAVVIVACDSVFFFTGGCTTVVVPAIRVTVIDSVTGESRERGSTVRARDGSFVDSRVVPDDSTLAPFPIQLADERAGTYVVSVSRAGYRDWTASNVRVRDEGCHVGTAHLVARLVRAPAI